MKIRNRSRRRSDKQMLDIMPIPEPSFCKIREALLELIAVLPAGCMTGFDQEKMYPECLICQQPLNIFKETIYNLEGCQNKHPPFHQSCLNKWVSYSPGERLVKAKSQCPVCKIGPIPPDDCFITRPVDLSGITDDELESKVYLKCQKCSKLFTSQFLNERCSASSVEATAVLAGEEGLSPPPPRRISDYETCCEECTVYDIVECPGCGNLLERSGGCSDMTCCIRGTGW